MKLKNVVAIKTLSAAVVAGIFILSSCSKSSDNPLTSTDTQNVNSESVADNSINETSDMTNSAAASVTNTQYATGRIDGVISAVAAKRDGRLAGATITITPGAGSTKDNPNGTITIDFGAAPGITTDGVTRIGKIIVTYAGKKGVAQSYRSIGYSGYSRNGIAFDDAMTFTNTNITDSTVFHHVLALGKLTFPDNSTLTRIADHYATVDYSALTLSLSATPNTTSSASGTTRGGKSYSMTITKPLVYKLACVLTKVIIPVSGTKTIIVDSKNSYTIDYGDGTCDNTFTVSLNGKVVTASATGDGH